MNSHEQYASARETGTNIDLEKFPFLNFSYLKDSIASQTARGLLLERSRYTESEHLPLNPYPLQEHFAEYPTLDEVVETVQDVSPAEHDAVNKVDFIDKSNPNIGWKFHLNVAPNSVVEAASYLLEHDYMFKYMGGPSGGNKPGDGKVFTVYVGSHAKATELAEPLAEDLSDILCRPEATNEVEFAPGVVGRFAAQDGSFTLYGPSGFVLVQGFVEMLQMEGLKQPYSSEVAERVELRSLDMLLSKYGSYFIDNDEKSED